MLERKAPSGLAIGVPPCVGRLADIAEIVSDVHMLTSTSGDIDLRKALLVAGLGLYLKAAGLTQPQFIKRAYHPAALH